MLFQSAFEYQGSPARVIFGPGGLSRLRDEIERLGAHSALVLTTAGKRHVGEDAVAELGPLAASIFSGAAMHTPVSVTEQAMASLGGVDCLIAIGGGSAIGLSKALALRSGLPQIVVPTTFAGSEATAILGQTEGRQKTTLSDPKVRPTTVIYDPALVSSLPLRMAATSALNAIAHSVEGLYAQRRNPISSLMAVEGIRVLAASLPRIQIDTSEIEAWSMAQYGAWLCGTVLGQVGMALHHKLCHVLGGSFDLPHADTHSVILPHAIAYNEAVVADALAPVARIFAAPTAAAGVFDFSRRIGAPASLSALGFAETDIPRAISIALSAPCWNPRPLTEQGLSRLLVRATRGDTPAP